MYLLKVRTGIIFQAIWTVRGEKESPLREKRAKTIDFL